MSNNKKMAVVEKAIKHGMLADIRNIIIYQEPDGTYQLFNKYTIAKIESGEYVVGSNTVTKHTTFYNLQNAAAWCIFDVQNKVRESSRIAELDYRLSSIDIDIVIHNKLFKKSKNTEEKLIYIAKLDDDRLKKKLITDELHTYLTDSKRWQTKRFDQKPDNNIRKINTTY